MREWLGKEGEGANTRTADQVLLLLRLACEILGALSPLHCIVSALLIIFDPEYPELIQHESCWK